MIVKMPPEGSRHQVALDDRHGFLEQYRKIGFREQHGKTSETVALDQALCDELGYEPQKGDTCCRSISNNGGNDRKSRGQRRAD